ncbi:MAG TPA: thermonuclease family protein [Burkholderiales bacterium]|nr:thermonuclease family protein [Burkholderiales bacterium]
MRWLLIVFLLLARSGQAETLSGTVIGVVDGDTLTIVDAQKRRYRVRLGQVDAPESKQAFGIKSARSLYGLCFRKAAQVEWQAKDQYNRHIGHVTCEGVDANAAQVRRGMAWVSPKSTQPGSALYELEAYARVRGIGLWSDPSPVPPWEWRPRNQTP